MIFWMGKAPGRTKTWQFRFDSFNGSSLTAGRRKQVTTRMVKIYEKHGQQSLNTVVNIPKTCQHRQT
jgi:hypothetical protein